MIYLNNFSLYWQQVRSVQKELRKTDLHLNAEMCDIYQTEATYLHQIIGIEVVFLAFKRQPVSRIGQYKSVYLTLESS